MKILFIIVSIPILVWANSFIGYDEFKKIALKNSNIIKKAKLIIKESKKNSEIELSFSNPSLGFNANRYEYENGWALELSQSIRLPSFGSDLKSLNIAKQEVAKASYLQIRAKFIRDLEKSYTSFVYQKHLELLLLEELKLAKKIENIAKSRLQNGVGTKATYLRAAIETQSIENRLLSQKLSIKQHYFELLSLASLTKQMQIEAKFIYPIEVDTTHHIGLNPDIIKAKLEQKKLNKEAKVLSHSIKSIDVLFGYEKESQDKIISLGAGLTLPIFSISKKQAQLAYIKANQNALELEQLKTKQELQKITLKNSLSTLIKQYNSLKTQKVEQERLLTLYEEGYQISKGSLLELIEVKNTLLQTSKNLLDIQKEANFKIIELNYLQGLYNE